MWFVLIIAFVVGVALSVHPGEAYRRTLRESTSAGGWVGTTGAYGGGLAAEALLILLVWVALIMLPDAVRMSSILRGPIWILCSAALVSAGWHRIETSSRLDLRRSELDRVIPESIHDSLWVDAALKTVTRPGWHLFWWAAAPGLVLLSTRADPWAGGLFVFVYALSGALWPAWMSFRAAWGEERILPTTVFRVVHSVAGLALVAIGLGILVRVLGTWPLEESVTRRLIEPLLGS